MPLRMRFPFPGTDTNSGVSREGTTVTHRIPQLPMELKIIREEVAEVEVAVLAAAFVAAVVAPQAPGSGPTHTSLPPLAARA